LVDVSRAHQLCSFVIWLYGNYPGICGVFQQPLRKSGKTSIIYAIERRLASSGSHYVSIDCESPSIHRLRWNELLFKIATLYHEERRSKIRPPNADNYNDKDCADQFARDMKKIYTSKKAAPTMFIFDEVERISPGSASSLHWRDGDDFIYFWQTMRAFYQRNPGVFTYLLVGTNPNCVESPTLNGHENPLFKSVPDSYVPSFDVSKVREMTRKLGRYMGMKYDEQIYGLLCDDFGGHPFLIRQFCSELHKQCTKDRPQTIRKPFYVTVKRSVERQIEEYLDMILTVLKENYEDEYDLMRMLASDDVSSFSEFANYNPRIIKHLLGYGLIIEDQGKYAFNIEAVKLYVSKKHKFDRVNLTAEEMRTEISLRRNRIEKRLRIVAYKVIALHKGKRQVKELVLSAISSSRREKVAIQSGDQLLNDEQSPLFFLELIEIINKNWELFENVFEERKDKILNALRDINESGRPDCHAKGIRREDFQQLRLHFNLLEDKLHGW